ncbi:YxlC family protein [Geomicrobium sp. JCM 19039]|uniref:YxlC family protein n=1 Tax=Geomicrobium sp. JCM 19039 TaxID=1460636 RepID=UPI00045F12E1|nr:YxlC family protein [Geomicrobium sp. JCM 19039]GAK12623.1 hypothetical protein JCM19039_2413 [Geomicrobium sp. JCM 19039]
MDENKLKEQLHQLHRVQPKQKPSPIEMHALVRETRKKKRFELAVFILIALFIASGTILLMTKQPYVFLAIQATIIFTVLLGLVARRKGAYDES